MDAGFVIEWPGMREAVLEYQVEGVWGEGGLCLLY